MKKMIRAIALVCVLSICLCGTSLFVSAASGADDTAQPWAEVYPDPDFGGSGLAVDYLIHMEAKHVENFLPSSSAYIGRSNLSGTERFGYVFTFYHSLASVTQNYAMRAGVCYYNATHDRFDLFDYVTEPTSGETYVRYIDKYAFSQNIQYHVFVTNTIGSGYIWGNIWFFRELSN